METAAYVVDHWKPEWIQKELTIYSNTESFDDLFLIAHVLTVYLEKSVIGKHIAEIK